ncbi:MAG: thioredoxin family protein [Promethearchaeota archaeon]
MHLDTPLEHIKSKEEHNELITQNEKAVVVCGRMGPMCVPVYGIMDALKKKYSDVAFRDMMFDIRDADVIRNLPEASQFRGLPFTVYYRNGKVVKATSSIQSAKDVKAIIKEVFA